MNEVKFSIKNSRMILIFTLVIFAVFLIIPSLLLLDLIGKLAQAPNDYLLRWQLVLLSTVSFSLLLISYSILYVIIYFKNKNQKLTVRNNTFLLIYYISYQMIGFVYFFINVAEIYILSAVLYSLLLVVPAIYAIINSILVRRKLLH